VVTKLEPKRTCGSPAAFIFVSFVRPTLEAAGFFPKITQLGTYRSTIIILLQIDAARLLIANRAGDGVRVEIERKCHLLFTRENAVGPDISPKPYTFPRAKARHTTEDGAK